MISKKGSRVYLDDGEFTYRSALINLSIAILNSYTIILRGSSAARTGVNNSTHLLNTQLLYKQIKEIKIEKERKKNRDR